VVAMAEVEATRLSPSRPSTLAGSQSLLSQAKSSKADNPGAKRAMKHGPNKTTIAAP